MSRFLFVVPPVAERVRPAAAVARELAARGHEVAWVGYRQALDGIVPAGATVVPVAETGHDLMPASVLRPVGGGHGPSALVVLWDDFLLPLAQVMLPAVQAAVDTFAPDVVVADQQALAGATVAHLSGLPWVTLVPTSTGVVDPLWDLPKIKRRIQGQWRRFLQDAGFDEVTAARTDPQTSPHLVIVFSTPALTGRLDRRMGRHVFVGPCLDPPSNEVGDAFDRGPPLVVVSLESPRWQRTPLYRAAGELLAPLSVRLAIVGPCEVVGDAPAGVRVTPRASLPALARKATAVVCDAGHRTVCEALRNGVPLVVAPMTGDQPVLADQVVRAGAGVRVSARSMDGARLRIAVERILTDTRSRRGARRVRDSFAVARGAPAAAEPLEALVGGPSTSELQR